MAGHLAGAVLPAAAPLSTLAGVREISLWCAKLETEIMETKRRSIRAHLGPPRDQGRLGEGRRREMADPWPLRKFGAELGAIDRARGYKEGLGTFVFSSRSSARPRLRWSGRELREPLRRRPPLLGEIRIAMMELVRSLRRHEDRKTKAWQGSGAL